MLFVLYRLTSFHNTHSRERFAFARRWCFNGVACSNNGGNKFILCYIKQRSRVSLSEAGCPGTRLSIRLPDPAHERLAVALRAGGDGSITRMTCLTANSGLFSCVSLPPGRRVPTSAAATTITGEESIYFWL